MAHDIGCTGQTIKFNVKWLTSNHNPITIIIENMVTLNHATAMQVAKEAIMQKYHMQNRPYRDDVIWIETKPTQPEDYEGMIELSSVLAPLQRTGIWM